MKRIVIEIGCGEMLCEECELYDRQYFLEHRIHHCGFFHKDLRAGDGKPLRCMECFRAEEGARNDGERA